MRIDKIKNNNIEIFSSSLDLGNKVFYLITDKIEIQSLSEIKIWLTEYKNSLLTKTVIESKISSIYNNCPKIEIIDADDAIITTGMKLLEKKGKDIDEIIDFIYNVQNNNSIDTPFFLISTGKKNYKKLQQKIIYNKLQMTVLVIPEIMVYAEKLQN